MEKELNLLIDNIKQHFQANCLRVTKKTTQNIKKLLNYLQITDVNSFQLKLGNNPMNTFKQEYLLNCVFSNRIKTLK